MGEARLPDGFPSYVTDDHTPFEFSIVVSGKKKPELRYPVTLSGRLDWDNGGFDIQAQMP